MKSPQRICVAEMKPLHWDAINPFTGKPFTFDDPNLRWSDPAYYLEPGDPGFVPYAQPAPARPKKAGKPFRRKLKPTDENPSQPTINMTTFQYKVAPNSNGGFTTRAARTHAADTTALLAAIAAEAGVTPEQTEGVLRGFFGKVLACASGCEWSPNFLDLVTFRPTSGGSAPLPDGFHNAADINANATIAFLAPVIENWRSGLTLESLGEVGKVTPEIDTVIRQSDLTVDKYTAGGLIQVRGDYLKFDPSDATQGVFFQPAAGAEVRATDYAAILPQSVIVLVPASLTGPLTVRVATHINGSVRSDTYTNQLTTP